MVLSECFWSEFEEDIDMEEEEDKMEVEGDIPDFRSLFKVDTHCSASSSDFARNVYTRLEAMTMLLIIFPFFAICNKSNKSHWFQTIFSAIFHLLFVCTNIHSVQDQWTRETMPFLLIFWQLN